MQLVSAWFHNRWKSQTQGGAPSSFDPVTDATTWTFNEVSRSMRVPVQSLRAADVTGDGERSLMNWILHSRDQPG